MATLMRAGLLFAKKAILPSSMRYLSVSNQLNIKEIQEIKKGETVIVEAVTLPSPHTDLLVRANNSLISSSEETKPCYMCSLGLDVKHTDVMILSQFVRSDGCMLPRRITGLCARQQKKVGKMVTMAQKAGLMINLTPTNCKKDPTKRRDYKKFNTYFDEKTIFMKRIPKQEDKFKR